MGKRRDRRHAAALGGGGRRMKLDLWNDDDAEKLSTNGRIVSKTATVEEGDENIGFGGDEGHSPQSLPGPVQVDPLSLLGQYSDEDEEEEQLSRANGSTKSGSANIVAGQVEEQVASFLADLETSGLLKDETVTHENELVTIAAPQVAETVNTDTSNGHAHREASPRGHGSPSFELQINGKPDEGPKTDIKCEWEAVLYKESGEYYYWNKVTGETTWEKPAALSEYEEWKKGSGLQDGLQKDNDPSIDGHLENVQPLLQKVMSAGVDADEQDVKVGMAVQEQSVVGLIDDTQLSTTENHAEAAEQPQSDDPCNGFEENDSLDIFPEVRENPERSECFPVGTGREHAELQDKEEEAEADATVVAREQNASDLWDSENNTLNIGLGSEKDMSGGSPARGVISADGDLSPSNQQEELATDRTNSRHIAEQIRRKHQSRLLERGETLAQQFKILAGETLHSLSARLRLVVEAEVRLSDCKAMAMENAPEEQFWSHMDLQMTRLESLLSLEEAAASAELEQQKLLSSSDGLHLENTQVAKKRAPAFRALRPPQLQSSSDSDNDVEVGAKLRSDMQESVQEVSSSPVQPEASAIPASDSMKSESHKDKILDTDVKESENVPAIEVATEDEDMEVDMEVDMDTEDGKEQVRESVDMNQEAVATPPVYQYPVLQSITYIPPEPLPPAVSHVPPEPHPHAVSYISPAVSLPPLVETPLFPSVTSLFPSVAPMYPVLSTLPALPSFPVDSWVPPPPPDEEWALPPLPEFDAPPPPPDDDPPPLPPSSAVFPLEVASLPPQPSSPPPPYPGNQSTTPTSYYSIAANESIREGEQGFVAETPIYYTDSAQLVAGDVDSASLYANGIVPSGGMTNTTAAETTSKKTGKVVRNKKRSHSTAVAASLRSNKKVSSMVNKWLAAKEELHSSEEEEEDRALFDAEALEKKRQKEIEEWRHQTLASGGALENANFQPLGTLDWRERVKRAKRETKKEATKRDEEAKRDDLKEKTEATEESKSEVPEIAHSANVTPPKKPDLKELSKDLPSGWQAFWDPESAEVYYGNLTTSATSWERPTS